MIKKNAKRSRGAAGMQVVEDEQNDADQDFHQEDSDGRSESVSTDNKPSRKAKAKPDQQSGGNVGIGEIKKAAAFASSVGGLDKAISLLQILKVAKEVQ